MPRLSSCLAAALLLASLALGCGGTSDASGGVLTLTASADSAVADGTWVTLTANAKDRYGAVGTGSIDFDVTNGQFYGFGRQNGGSADLDKGTTTIKVGCFQTENPLCVGGQVVHAAWNGVDAYVAVKFTQVL